MLFLRPKFIRTLGKKVATAGLVAEYEKDSQPIEKPGHLSALVAYTNEQRLCVIETTKVELVRFGDVTFDFALAEGEGHTTLEEWKKDHIEFFRTGGFEVCITYVHTHIHIRYNIYVYILTVQLSLHLLCP